MTRHPASRRIHQQETPDDALTEKLLRLVLWAKRNIRILATAAVVIVLATLGTIYSANVREARRAEAAMRLNEVRQTVLSGNHALAVRDLEAFIGRFSGTTSADEARLLMAQVSLESGEAAKAIETLQPLARKLDSPLGAPAAFLLGAAYDQSGDAAQAEATFLRLADNAPLSYQRREALEQAARITEAKGDAARAVELYQRLVSLTQENSPERSIAELRLAEARARAGIS
jgi:predicted negative regulator of RcsB-dependent stress response